MNTGYDILHVDTETHSINSFAGLLSDVFGRPELFTPAYIRWQYAENPDGKIVGFNAMDGSSLAAHYVAQPLQAIVDGRMDKGLLSLNTATHPAHQGKGLFVKLAERTYQYAADQGYSFVIGVANQNSVHGFIKKLGFQQVGQLHALLGAGQLPYTDDRTGYSYARHWSPESLSWRLANPSAKYGIDLSRHISITSPTAYPGIKATLGMYDRAAYDLKATVSPLSLLNLWIGADRHISTHTHTYFNIPHRLRPAPLYLIHKPLKAGISPLHFDDILFQALDFDAY